MIFIDDFKGSLKSKMYKTNSDTPLLPRSCQLAQSKYKKRGDNLGASRSLVSEEQD